MPTTLQPRLARRSDRFVSSAIRDLLHLADRSDVLSLAGGLPDGSTFALERIAAAADRALATPGRYGSSALQYGASEGLTEFREWVASGSLVHQGCNDVAATLVTTGSQQALDLLARALVDPGDLVVVEDPVYLGARQALLSAGATLVGIGVDADGLNVDALTERLQSGLRPRLVYTVPHFQNPTGATLSEARRIVLAELAQEFGFVIVEDDPYIALAFDGARSQSLAALAPDHTVTLGSASKVLAPGLRIGWLRAPAWLHRTLVLAKQSSDLHTPSLNQLIALDVLSDERFMIDHLHTLRSTYRAKAEALHAGVAELFGCTQPHGGMFLWGEARADTSTALPRALAAGVAYVPGAAFAVDVDRSRAVRLSYASLNLTELKDAAVRLCAVFS